jgi:WD40 repeat protein
LKYNSGKFTDFALSPINNSVVSTGEDGIVRLWDYGSQREFYSKSFPNSSQANCIEWIPFHKKNQGRMIAVGFQDGIVRFLYLDPKGFSLVKAIKVHRTGIIKVKSSRDGSVVVVCDSSGSLFFISL